jgi:hypothetical protein
MNQNLFLSQTTQPSPEALIVLVRFRDGGRHITRVNQQMASLCLNSKIQCLAVDDDAGS